MTRIHAIRASDRKELAILAVTWLMRIFIGALFIFSGFTKAIDVWGTVYKFNEYFSVWGYEIWDSLNLVGVFVLCLAEFLTGFCLLFGCFRRTAPVLAVLIMAFMLPLTLWLAIKNPVSDCGCFGDALKLTNWQTFYKNVVITVGAVWLLIFNRRCINLINPYLQWFAVLATSIYLLAIAWIGYTYQPLIDFRPYKVGTELVESDDTAEIDEDDYLRFVYERDGQRHEFTIDDELPDEEDGWTFVERYYALPEDQEAKVVQPDFGKSHLKNLRLFSEDGKEDLTDQVIGNGRQLILMIPKLSEISAAKTWKINSFYKWCEANDIEMIATVGGNPYEIETWKDISLAEYPIYTSDDTSIEEVVRGNPGIIYIEDGIIKWKSSLKAIDIDDFQEEEYTNDPMSFARDNSRILTNLTWIFLAIVVFLIFLSFSPSLLMKVLRHDNKNARRVGKPEGDNDGLSQ